MSGSAVKKLKHGKMMKCNILLWSLCAFSGGVGGKNGVKMRRVETRLTAFYHAALILHAKSHVQCQVAL